MLEVKFLAAGSTSEEAMSFICKLTFKLINENGANQKIDIRCQNIDDAMKLDNHLWIEPKESFIPHNLSNNRTEKDTVQTLAQADALAVHIETGNLRAAQRLMRQLPELLQTFPDNYRRIDLKEMKNWIKDMISVVPPFGEITNIVEKKPPKLIHC